MNTARKEISRMEVYNMQEWLGLFRNIAAEAEARAKQLYGTEKAREKLGRGAGGDITVYMDKEMEDILIKHLKEKGNVKLISEEAGIVTFGTPEVVVVADPLDGSYNAKTGIPFFAISLALAPVPEGNTDFTPRIKDIELGYIKNLVSGDEYWGIKGGGAFKNGEMMEKLPATKYGNFAAELSPHPAEAFARFAPLLDTNSRVRCIGSLALDLAHTAEGIFDCLLDLRKELCRALDTCGGILMLKEMGGVVSDDKGNSLDEKPISVTESFNLVACRDLNVQKRVLRELRN